MGHNQTKSKRAQSPPNKPLRIAFQYQPHASADIFGKRFLRQKRQTSVISFANAGAVGFGQKKPVIGSMRNCPSRMRKIAATTATRRIIRHDADRLKPLQTSFRRADGWKSIRAEKGQSLHSVRCERHYAQSQ